MPYNDNQLDMLFKADEATRNAFLESVPEANRAELLQAVNDFKARKRPVPYDSSMDAGVGTTKPMEHPGMATRLIRYLTERERQKQQRIQSNPLKELVSRVGNAAMPYSLGGLYRTVTGEEKSPQALPDPTPAGMAKGITNVPLGIAKFGAEARDKYLPSIPSPADMVTAPFVQGRPMTGSFNREVLTPAIAARNKIYNSLFNPSATGEGAGEMIATGGVGMLPEGVRGASYLKSLLMNAGKGVVSGAAGAAMSPEEATGEEYWGLTYPKAVIGGTLGGGSALIAETLSPAAAKYMNATRRGEFKRPDPKLPPAPQSMEPQLPDAARAYEAEAAMFDIPTDASNLPGAPHYVNTLGKTLKDSTLMGLGEHVKAKSEAATRAGLRIAGTTEKVGRLAPFEELSKPSPGREATYNKLKEQLSKISNKSTPGELLKMQANIRLYNAKVDADRVAGGIASEADALGPMEMGGLLSKLNSIKNNYVEKYGEKANPSVLRSIDETISSLAGTSDKEVPTGLLDEFGWELTKTVAGEPPASFSRAKSVRSINNAELKRFTTGENALVSKEEAVPLTQVNEALEEAMRGHVAQKPDLSKRYESFLNQYKRTVVPFKNPEIAAALAETSKPQEVYSRIATALPEGQEGNKMLNAIVGLKGRKLMTSEWMNDVIRYSGAGNETTGRTVPTLADASRGLQNQVNPRRALERVNNTLRQLNTILPQGTPERQHIDAYFRVISRMPELASSPSAKLQWTDVWLRAPLSVTRGLLTSDKGKKFLLAANKFKNQAAFDKFVSENLPYVIGAQTSSDKLKTLLGGEE